jgi:hypothetical protein
MGLVPGGPNLRVRRNSAQLRARVVHGFSRAAWAWSRSEGRPSGQASMVKAGRFLPKSWKQPRLHHWRAEHEGRVAFQESRQQSHPSQRRRPGSHAVAIRIKLCTPAAPGLAPDVRACQTRVHRGWPFRPATYRAGSGAVRQLAADHAYARVSQWSCGSLVSARWLTTAARS